MREQAELWEEDGICEQEKRKTTKGKIIEEGEVFEEAFWLLVDVVVAGDEHDRQERAISIVFHGRVSIGFGHTRRMT